MDQEGRAAPGKLGVALQGGQIDSSPLPSLLPRTALKGWCKAAQEQLEPGHGEGKQQWGEGRPTAPSFGEQSSGAGESSHLGEGEGRAEAHSGGRGEMPPVGGGEGERGQGRGTEGWGRGLGVGQELGAEGRERGLAGERLMTAQSDTGGGAGEVTDRRGARGADNAEGGGRAGPVTCQASRPRA